MKLSGTGAWPSTATPARAWPSASGQPTEALSYLGVDGPAADEELVCVTENDACGVDACRSSPAATMGKGNLLYRGTGKMAFSFYCRNSGASVRLCLKALPDMEREERRRFILEAPLEQVFSMGAPRFPVPEKAPPLCLRPLRRMRRDDRRAHGASGGRQAPLPRLFRPL